MLLCTRRLCVCKWLEWLKLLLHSEHLYGLSPVWTLMWSFRLVDWLNALSHMWHLYGFSPVWTVMWSFRLPDCLNALSHMWHLYGFSPLWILLCLTNVPDSVNRLLQTVHSNGFSPEWILMWTARPLPLSQHLPHSVHLYLLLWIFMCWLRLLWDEKYFSHSLHKYTFSPVCLFLCLLKPLLLTNRLLHTVHTYGVGLSSCGCSVISLLSASIFTSKQLSPVYISQHYMLFHNFNRQQKTHQISRNVNTVPRLVTGIHCSRCLSVLGFGWLITHLKAKYPVPRPRPCNSCHYHPQLHSKIYTAYLFSAV